MAITVETEILGQEATAVATYCYLYEPLRVRITEDDLLATKIFIDLQPFQVGDGIPITTETEYAVFDINPGEGVTVDLMEIVKQYHDANVYKFSEVDEMDLGDGFKAIIDSYRYKFHIYTDQTPTPIEVYKLPIIGGRMLEQFVPAVGQSQALNEFEYYGLDTAELKTRWGNISFVEASLSDPNVGGSVIPTITKLTPGGTEPCGGFIIWKSRFGGWMFWGMDIQSRGFSKTYAGKLEVGMFESTLAVGGNPFTPVDYTGINTSYSRNLKALSLTAEELLAVAGIHASPAVYYQEVGSEKLELMRLTAASTPVGSLANGGDFSVSLQSISITGQKTI